MVNNARFRKARWLVVGCGDVGGRLVQRIARRITVCVLTSSPDKIPALRQLGVRPLLGDLDQRRSLHRLRGLGQRLIYLAPPLQEELIDQRSKNLIAALRKQPLHKVVYISTSGVYGDCAGAWIDETRMCNPQSPRAQRRMDAEHRWRSAQTRTSAVRLPGIYNETRAQRLAEHFMQNLPILQTTDDVYSNRVHAEDAARAVLLAAFRAPAQRNYHIGEDSGSNGVRWSDFMEQAAYALGFEKPQRVDKKTLAQHLSPARMGFLSESRRLNTRRMQRELGLYIAPKALV